MVGVFETKRRAKQLDKLKSDGMEAIEKHYPEDFDKLKQQCDFSLVQFRMEAQPFRTEAPRKPEPEPVQLIAAELTKSNAMSKPFSRNRVYGSLPPDAFELWLSETDGQQQIDGVTLDMVLFDKPIRRSNAKKDEPSFTHVAVTAMDVQQEGGHRLRTRVEGLAEQPPAQGCFGLKRAFAITQRDRWRSKGLFAVWEY